MTDTSLTELITPLLAEFNDADLAVLTGIVVVIANADGEVDPDERAAIKRVFEAAFESTLSDFVISALIDDALQAMQSDGAEAYAQSLGEKLAGRSLAEEGVRLAVAIGNANADFSETERGLTKLIAEGAGIGAGRLAELTAE